MISAPGYVTVASRLSWRQNKYSTGGQLWLYTEQRQEGQWKLSFHNVGDSFSVNPKYTLYNYIIVVISGVNPESSMPQKGRPYDIHEHLIVTVVHRLPHAGLITECPQSKMARRGAFSCVI